jgi:hypothetical protein
MKHPWMIGLVAASAMIASVCGWAADNAKPFDRPLHKQHLTLPPNPSDPNPEAHPEVSCWYYPGLMVKELDLDWIKGAAQLSMVHLKKGQAEPECRRENIDGEYVVQDWNGAFQGVRQGYVFFTAADGDAFAVYDGADRKIFADAADAFLSIEPMLPPPDPELRPWYYAPLVLNYQKVYLAPCSMRSDGAHCWTLVKRATGLTQKALPDCDAAYKAQEKTTPPEYLDDLRKDPSIIVYAVEAVIDRQGVARLTATSPVLECYPAP